MRESIEERAPPTWPRGLLGGLLVGGVLVVMLLPVVPFGIIQGLWPYIPRWYQLPMVLGLELGAAVPFLLLGRLLTDKRVLAVLLGLYWVLGLPFVPYLEIYNAWYAPQPAQALVLEVIEVYPREVMVKDWDGSGAFFFPMPDPDWKRCRIGDEVDLRVGTGALGWQWWEAISSCRRAGSAAGLARPPG